MKYLPIINKFISLEELEELEEDPKTVVYLATCAFAIFHGVPKESYRILFSELRLRNVYGLLEDLTAFIISIPFFHNYILHELGKEKIEASDVFSHSLTQHINESIINSIGDTPVSESSMYDKDGVVENVDLINKTIMDLSNKYEHLKGKTVDDVVVSDSKPDVDADADGSVLTWTEWIEQHGLEEINEEQ